MLELIFASLSPENFYDARFWVQFMQDTRAQHTRVVLFRDTAARGVAWRGAAWRGVVGR